MSLCTVGNEPQTLYAVFGGRYFNDMCCFGAPAARPSSQLLTDRPVADSSQLRPLLHLTSDRTSLRACRLRQRRERAWRERGGAQAGHDGGDLLWRGLRPLCRWRPWGRSRHGSRSVSTYFTQSISKRHIDVTLEGERCMSMYVGFAEYVRLCCMCSFVSGVGTATPPPRSTRSTRTSWQQWSRAPAATTMLSRSGTHRRGLARCRLLMTARVRRMARITRTSVSSRRCCSRSLPAPRSLLLYSGL